MDSDSDTSPVTDDPTPESELDVRPFVYLADRNTVGMLRDPIARRAAWRDRAAGSLWQLPVRD